MNFRIPFALVVTPTAGAVSQQVFAQMDHGAHGMNGTAMAPAAAPMVQLDWT